ncbi:hypothetical protein TSUD_123700 [Trifolium subterraneum]|uniref:Uncharacterized protein n=1 Tax=Trifolium subterraneum TaxID=3900 RepID=A0A2Z6P2Q0_TRISU|nr:hypothetical protein TSUD_123700 [Trifolium subterraneum]
MDEQGIESSQSVKAHDSTSEPISGHKNYSPLKDEQGIESSQSLKPTIINIVSTVNLACKLDLQSIKLKAPTAEYNPQASLLIRHPSVSMRIRAPESKAQINSSGMMAFMTRVVLDSRDLQFYCNCSGTDRRDTTNVG